MDERRLSVRVDIRMPTVTMNVCFMLLLHIDVCVSMCLSPTLSGPHPHPCPPAEDSLCGLSGVSNLE